FSFNSKHGWCPECYGTGLKLDRVEWDEERAKTGTEDHVLDSWIEWLEVDEVCPGCDGKRLNREALAVHYRERSISELAALPVGGLEALFRGLARSGREAEVARGIVAELTARLALLVRWCCVYRSLPRC